MANTYQSRNAQTLTHLLKRINQGDDPKLLRKEANQLIKNVGPKDIAIAEQNLIADGYSTQAVQVLSATFVLMGMHEEQSGNPKTWLPANHILWLITVEHDLTRHFLADLNDLVEAINCLSHLTDVSSEFRKLAHITEHFKAMKEHLQREDDVIFPYLRRYGWNGWISLCGVVQADHISIKNEIDNLLRLVVSFNNINFEDFKVELASITGQLYGIILQHLSQEDNILYPIALGIIKDAEVWDEMKAICDQMGYCGVHL